MEQCKLTKDEDKLRYFLDLYQVALSKRPTKFNHLKEQYLGERKLQYSNVQPRVVRNVTFELIESQVSSSIPTPKAVGKTGKRKSERNAEIITELLKNLRDELPFEKINDVNERNTYIYGTDFVFVQWDEKNDTLCLMDLSPEQVVLQPDQQEIQDMDYLFITYTDTVKKVYEKYKKVVYGEKGEESVDVIIGYFKKDGKIGEVVFTKDTLLSYIPNYYAKRRVVCKSCGKIKELCQCGKFTPTKEIVEFEEISEDIKVIDGIIPKKMPKFINGVMQVENVFDDKTGEYIEVPKLKRTRLPLFTPTLFPIAVRKNICLSNSFYGLSDAEMVWGYQQEINKLETRIIEKLLKAGAIPYSAESTDLKLTDEIYTRGIKLKNPQERSLLGVLDLEVSINQDVAESERLYQQAKRTLGITDSFQGLGDETALSGIAKQTLINQAGARLSSKRVMKNAFYADLDKISFQFFVAFSKNGKEMAKKDACNNCISNTFSKYDFLELDKDGNYYYNVDYMFSIDQTTDLVNNRDMMWSEIKSNYQLGTYGNPNTIETKLIYWQNMERARYPFAKENMEMLTNQNKVNSDDIGEIL